MVTHKERGLGIRSGEGHIYIYDRHRGPNHGIRTAMYYIGVLDVESHRYGPLKSTRRHGRFLNSTCNMGH